MAREDTEAAAARWEQLAFLQAEMYPHFIPFLIEGMKFLGFGTSEIQKDIASFIEHGPQYLMVQAQRGQAKTTIVALYAVWSLIHNPKLRVLIISAGGAQASEISTLIIKTIQFMPELECMRPDTNEGDRSSVDHFDVHYSLKGVDKSPSVACVGITSNMQGKRADILIADDIESMKNSLTQLMRAQLHNLTLDFVSICSTGRIIWLGTPQSMDSIYNSLPGRGVSVRIWPGRYPTAKQIENYGDMLAPLLAKRLQMNPLLGQGGGMLGDQGQPIEQGTKAGWLDEEALCKKERDQGAAYFQLQHMLNTKLVDALRYPLKLTNAILLAFGENVPIEVTRGMTVNTLQDRKVGTFSFKIQTAHYLSPEVIKAENTLAYIDPAGGGANGDETAYCVTSFVNSNIWVREVGGLPGGYDDSTMQELAKRLCKHRLTRVVIEKNFGYGGFAKVFTPILKTAYLDKELNPKGYPCPAIEEDMVHGQKERRICDTLEPVMGRGSLIFHEEVIEQDTADCERYAPGQRVNYSLFHQLAKMTREKDAVIHDDRADCLEGGVRMWSELMAIDQKKATEAARKKAYEELIRDPLGHKRYGSPDSSRKGKSLLSRFH